jgi:hypothetical protein
VGGLSFQEFVRGMLALDPNTPNDGPWRAERAAIIFRVSLKNVGIVRIGSEGCAHHKGVCWCWIPIFPTMAPGGPSAPPSSSG